MASKLVLRNTQNASPNVDLSVIGVAIVYDMLKDLFGAAVDTAVVNTIASGTEVIFTKTAGGSTIAWVSGRVPAGGFTLTTTDISAWLRESNMNANCGGRFRVYRYTPGNPPTLTELGGGPFNDGVEFSTASTEMLWPGNVTDQVFAENERTIVKLFITNVGTMGGGFTCTMEFNAADAVAGDSFFNIAETVAFKPEDQQVSPSGVISAEAFGTQRVDLEVAGAGAVASAEAHGAQRVDLTVTHVVLDDDFDRANSDSLGFPWLESEEEPTALTVNTFKVRALSVLQGIATVDKVFKNDQWAEIAWDLETTPSTTVDFTAGVFVRGSGTVASFTGYGLGVKVVDGVVTALEVRKWVGEILTANNVLATITPAPTFGDLLALEVVGTRIRVYKNNIFLQEIVDSAIASGKAGIFTTFLLGIAGNFLEFDNFGSGDMMAINTEEKFGTATVTVVAGDQTVSPSSIGTAEAFGSARVDFNIVPGGIVTAEVFGAATVAFPDPAGYRAGYSVIRQHVANE